MMPSDPNENLNDDGTKQLEKKGVSTLEGTLFFPFIILGGFLI